jgi:chromosome partitioning protein
MNTVKKQIRICISSNAGGSGKTTTTVHLAYGLARRGYKVVIIELDGSGSIASFTGLNLNPTPEQSVALLLKKDFAGEYPLQNLWEAYTPGIQIIQGGGPIEHVIRYIPQHPRGFYFLKDRLDDYPIDADIVLIDTPASLEPMGVVALAASTHVLSPIKAEIKDVEGFANFIGWYYRQIGELKLNPKPEILGFIPTRIEYQRATHRNLMGVDSKGQVRTDLAEPKTLPAVIQKFGIYCFPMVRDSNNYLNATRERKPVGVYRPGSDAARDYEPIVERIVEILKGA